MDKFLPIVYTMIIDWKIVYFKGSYSSLYLRRKAICSMYPLVPMALMYPDWALA